MTEEVMTEGAVIERAGRRIGQLYHYDWCPLWLAGPLGGEYGKVPGKLPHGRNRPDLRATPETRMGTYKKE